MHCSNSAFRIMKLDCLLSPMESKWPLVGDLTGDKTVC